MFSCRTSKIFRLTLNMQRVATGGLMHVGRRRVSFAVPDVAKRYLFGFSAIGASWGATFYGLTYENPIAQLMVIYAGMPFAFAITFFGLFFYIPFGSAVMIARFLPQLKRTYVINHIV